MTPIRILMLEDNPLDAELTLTTLEDGGVVHSSDRVETREGFLDGVTRGGYDLILADYSLPQFDGISALNLARERCPEIPFLFVSGALGEERAVDTLTGGATDYVLKHRLDRLVPAVRRAIREAEERRERHRAEQALRESEERFRLLIESAHDYAIISLDPAGLITDWNPGAERILGYPKEKILGEHFSCFYTAEDVAGRRPDLELEQASTIGRASDENWLVRTDGSRFWASGVVTPLRDEHGALRGFAKILRDLSERKELEDALRLRVQQLAEADRRKDEFLAMLGHELRNPLAPIKNAVQIMKLRRLDDPTLNWTRDVVDRQVEQMTRLVDDLLDISRITLGKIRLQKSRVDLAAVVHRAVETVRPLVTANRHDLDVVLPGEPVEIEADAARLAQVVANLLNNAAKYTEPGGRITLTAVYQAGTVEIRVKDTGVGIAPELLAKVFDLFTQADRSLDRAQGGLGIGLTLVSRLVEMHGGTVRAFSDGPGKGSEFVIRLPCPAAEPAPPEVPASKPDAPAGRNILVVDDNVDAAESLAVLLRLMGHQVEAAHDGLTAIQAVKSRRPHVVLLDIGLPGLSGYEVANQLRSADGVAPVLIAMSGYGQEDNLRRAQALGFKHYLVKPVDPQALQTVLGAT